MYKFRLSERKDKPKADSLNFYGREYFHQANILGNTFVSQLWRVLKVFINDKRLAQYKACIESGGSEEDCLSQIPQSIWNAIVEYAPDLLDAIQSMGLLEEKTPNQPITETFDLQHHHDFRLVSEKHLFKYIYFTYRADSYVFAVGYDMDAAQLTIEFYDDESGYKMTNKGEPLKVINTVVGIAYDAMDRLDQTENILVDDYDDGSTIGYRVEVIEIDGLPKKMKLYVKYLKQLLPDATIWQTKKTTGELRIRVIL